MTRRLLQAGGWHLQVPPLLCAAAALCTLCCNDTTLPCIPSCHGTGGTQVAAPAPLLLTAKPRRQAGHVAVIQVDEWQLPRSYQDLALASHETGVYAWLAEQPAAGESADTAAWALRQGLRGVQAVVYVHHQHLWDAAQAPDAAALTRAPQLQHAPVLGCPCPGGLRPSDGEHKGRFWCTLVADFALLGERGWRGRCVAHLGLRSPEAMAGGGAPLPPGMEAASEPFLSSQGWEHAAALVLPPADADGDGGGQRRIVHGADTEVRALNGRPLFPTPFLGLCEGIHVDVGHVCTFVRVCGCACAGM